MTTPASERDRARAHGRARANEAGGAARASSRRDRGSTTTTALAVDWDVSHVAATTLVTVRVENTTERPRRVRLDNRLDGPVAPPRRHGVPEAGWDDDGVTRLLPGAETLSIGYACQAPPETPPVTVHDEPSDGGDEAETATVERALRSLGAFAPPRAALPDDGSDPRERVTVSPEGDAGETIDRQADSTDGPIDAGDRVDDSVGRPTTSRERPVDAGGRVGGTERRIGDSERQRGDERLLDSDRDATGSSGHSTDPATGATSHEGTYDAPTGVVDGATGVVDADGSSATDVPATVEAWFEAVEARLVTADRLGGDVREATPVLASLGGRAGVDTLASRLDGDAAALRTVAARATTLADRIDETDVPDVGAEE
ncbi:DUF7857 domain-containing protein [Salinigranum salinum]|uniref:DUF7857 domain-containing protein n=1 Tax=Salinigranum salinum TaxID=1364937 RepID=UPI001261109B|nr:hypothetical protein [Salinigranum salinum]